MVDSDELFETDFEPYAPYKVNAKFFSLRQGNSSTQDYVPRFSRVWVAMRKSYPKVPEQLYIDFFINSLSPNISGFILNGDPTSMEKAFRLALGFWDCPPVNHTYYKNYSDFEQDGCEPIKKQYRRPRRRSNKPKASSFRQPFDGRSSPQNYDHFYGGNTYASSERPPRDVEEAYYNMSHGLDLDENANGPYRGDERYTNYDCDLYQPYNNERY